MLTSGALFNIIQVMKKIILKLIVIFACALMTLTFAACSSVNLQGNCWEDKETFNYTATKDGVGIGTLSIKSVRIPRNAEAVRVEGLDKSFQVSGGTKIETEYMGSDGKTMYSIGLLDASNKTPVASYRVEKDKEGNILNESKAVYTTDGNKYVCTYSYTGENGKTGSGEFKQSGLFCDNATIYYIIRTFSHSSLSQSLTVPYFQDEKVVTLKVNSVLELKTTNAAVALSEKTATGDPVLSTKDSFDLIRVKIALSTIPAGEPNYVDYTIENDTQSFGRASTPSTKIPFKITEGDIVYVLGSIAVSA